MYQLLREAAFNARTNKQNLHKVIINIMENTVCFIYSWTISIYIFLKLKK